MTLNSWEFILVFWYFFNEENFSKITKIENKSLENAHEHLLSLGMIKTTHNGYEHTKRLTVFIQYIKKLPLPKNTWKMEV